MALVSEEAKARKAEYMKAWRKANREKLRAYNREWLEANKEQNAEKARVRSLRYVERHKEAIAEKRKSAYQDMTQEQKLRRSGYAVADKERRRELGRRWVRDNPGKAAAQVAKRRARLLQATPPWADLDQIRIVYELAEYMERLDGVDRHVDHIVPLRGKKVSGLHVPCNLRIVDADTNRKKGARYVG